MKNNINTRIPVSPFLNVLRRFRHGRKERLAKRRLFFISGLAILVAAFMSLVAKLLVGLINVVTNIFFFGTLDLTFRSPAGNHLGLWVILIPVLGGALVGMMALYGSKAIRGHGIPEAMEQVLTNQSKIKPAIAVLKPVSSAIAIGTGGPFGAEGPIIATGGALGSTLGQLIHVTSNERKIILAAGATAGMSAIFGTPIAAIFLAIELLLFEFSPKAIIPVALACITGGAGHHLFFEAGPVFPMPVLSAPSNLALGIYSVIGIGIGLVAVGLTKLVYFIEDAFERLPVHWMWWPAIGGLAVGLIGFIAPQTLGVGYDNIVNLLSGKLSLTIMLSLCIFKFMSWAIALGSGTSGGTLAPLMTIGSATGAIAGYLVLDFFPGVGITLPMAALVGMSAMFAGASRAYLTSILFSLEATHQINGLLPLLAACSGAYLISFFIMEHTIMTEKIARRGVISPDAYEPDPLTNLTVSDALEKQVFEISPSDRLGEVRALINRSTTQGAWCAVTEKGNFKGFLNIVEILQSDSDPEQDIASLLKESNVSLRPTDTLHKAAEVIVASGNDCVPVCKPGHNGAFVGILSCRDIVSSYHRIRGSGEIRERNLSYSVQRKKILSKGRKLLNGNFSR